MPPTLTTSCAFPLLLTALKSEETIDDSLPLNQHVLFID